MSRVESPEVGGAPRIGLWATTRRVGELYLTQLGLLLTIGVAVGIPVGLVETLVGRVELSDASAIETGTALGAALAGLGFVLFAGQLYEGIAGEVAAYAHRGRARPSAAAIARSLPLWRLLGANVLYVGATLAGLLLLIVPGVIVFTRYAPVTSLIALEGLSIRDAFRRSSRLVRGSFWRVLLIVGLGYLVASELDQALGLAEAELLGESFLADWAATALATALLTPIAAVTTVVVTLRLMEIHSRRASALSSSADPRRERPR